MTLTMFRPTWVVTCDLIDNDTQFISVVSVHHSTWDASRACVDLFKAGSRAYAIEVWYRPDSRTPRPNDSLALLRDGLDPIAVAPDV